MAQQIISNGPSKYDLMLALFEGKVVIFELDDGFFLNQVSILSLERESGDGQTWNFVGFCSGQNDEKIKGHYSTKTRNGWLKPL